MLYIHITSTLLELTLELHLYEMIKMRDNAAVVTDKDIEVNKAGQKMKIQEKSKNLGRPGRQAILTFL